MKENHIDAILVPGLGADDRVFAKYLQELECVVFDWFLPEINENIEDYVNRWCKNKSYRPKIILGVSFGGIIADALKGHYPNAKLVLVSSFYARSQRKPWLKLTSLFLRRSLVEFCSQSKCVVFLYFLFGVKEESEKRLLKEIVQETDFHYLKWALKQIGEWKKTAHCPDMCIHGNSDKMIRGVKTEQVIELEGGHFIIFQKAEEINALIQKSFVLGGE